MLFMLMALLHFVVVQLLHASYPPRLPCLRQKAERATLACERAAQEMERACISFDKASEVAPAAPGTPTARSTPPLALCCLTGLFVVLKQTAELLCVLMEPFIRINIAAGKCIAVTACLQLSQAPTHGPMSAHFNDTCMLCNNCIELPTMLDAVSAPVWSAAGRQQHEYP